MTSELQQNRYDRLIRRIGGIVGPGSKVNEVLSELFPMIDVEGNRGELQFVQGTVLGMGAQNLDGVLLDLAKIQLFNPEDSGAIVTITSLFISVLDAATIRVGRSTTPLSGGIGTQLARDTRQLLSDRPTAQMFSEISPGFVDGNMQFQLGELRVFKLQDENGVSVLSPGNGLSVGTNVAGGNLTVTFFWRERVAESSELNF